MFYSVGYPLKFKAMPEMGVIMPLAITFAKCDVKCHQMQPIGTAAGDADIWLRRQAQTLRA